MSRVLASLGLALGSALALVGPTSGVSGRVTEVKSATASAAGLRVTFAIGAAIGGPGTAPGKLNQPVDVTLDKSGNVIVADTGNNRVQKFKPDGTLIWAVGDKAGNGPGQFNRPKDAAVAPDGSILVADADNNRVVRLRPDGAFLAAYAVGFPPQAVTIASDGMAYLSNSVHFRVEKMNSAGVIVGGWGRGGGRSFDPVDITVSGGFVYTADAKYGSNDVPLVDKFRLDGTLVKFWGKEGKGPGDFKLPEGVSASGDSVYVVDKELDRLYEFDTEGNLRVQLGIGLRAPSGLFAQGDDLVVADSGNDRVIRIVKAFAAPSGSFCDTTTGTCTLGSDGVPIVSMGRTHRSSVRFVNPTDICQRLGRGPSISKTAFYNSKTYPVQRTSAGFMVEIPAQEVASASVIVVSKCPKAKLAALIPAQFSQDTATENWGNTVLYDPSGFVRDRATGKGIAGALVTLLSAPSFSGPFGFADPSTLSPTINPQRTDRTGHYGWDVPKGYYRIQVRRFGYFKLRASRVVSVPPAVTNLNVVLRRSRAEQLRLLQASGGVGPLRLGMPAAAARRAAQSVQPGARLVIVGGRLVRVELQRRAFRTALDVGVGSSESDLRLAYGLQLKRKGPAYRLGRITFLVAGANGATGRVKLVRIGG